MNATVVIVVIDRQQQRIFVAADSKVVSLVSQIVTQTCKIGGSPNCIFAIVGNASVEGFYDGPAMARDVCNGSEELSEKAKAFVNIAHPRVFAALTYFKTKLPNIFQTMYGKDAFVAFFAGRQNGQFQLFAYTVFVSNEGDISDRLVPQDESAPVVPLFLGGRNREILKNVKAHPITDATDFLKQIRKWLQLELIADPLQIGKPMSILEIRHPTLARDPDAISSQWIERGACNDADIGK